MSFLQILVLAMGGGFVVACILQLCSDAMERDNVPTDWRDDSDSD